MNIFSGNYDKELIYGFYLQYLEDKSNETLDCLLRYIAPLINLSAMSFLKKHDCEIDVISNEALEHLYFLFISDKLEDVPRDNPNHLSTFLWRVVNRSFVDSLRRNKLIDQSSIEVLHNNYVFVVSRSITHNDVEIRLYLDNLKNMLFYMVRSDIRFIKLEYEACVFITSCILGLVNLSPRNAQYRYNLSSKKLSFFIDYINYLIRINKLYLLENGID